MSKRRYVLTGYQAGNLKLRRGDIHSCYINCFELFDKVKNKTIYVTRDELIKKSSKVYGIIKGKFFIFSPMALRLKTCLRIIRQKRVKSTSIMAIPRGFSIQEGIFRFIDLYGAEFVYTYSVEGVSSVYDLIYLAYTYQTKNLVMEGNTIKLYTKSSPSADFATETTFEIINPALFSKYLFMYGSR